MKHVLILDTNPLPLNSSLLGLPEGYHEHVCLEEVKYIYQVIRKLLISPGDSTDSPGNHYDLLIIGFTSPDKDMEKMHFIRYIKRNKPELPLLIFSHSEKEWLIKQRLRVKNDQLAPVADRRDIQAKLGIFLESGILD